MNIALINDWLTNVAGTEKVLLALKETYPEAQIYTSVFDKEKAKPFAGFRVKTSFLQKWPLLKKKRELLVPLTPFAFENLDLSQFDLVISNTTMAAKGVITKPETIHICYCHTPSRYLWEPEIDKRASRGLFSWLRRKVTKKLKIWDRVAAARPDYYFANSNYISKRVKKYYNRDSKVIYPPVNVDLFSVGKLSEVRDYYLFVSRLIEYKKCDLVIKAFNELKLPLKIMGDGPEKKRLKKMAKKNIEFLGYLSDNELKDYYRRARAFIFAAEEDFGIVPVEAMASGRPVIAYGRGGALETVVAGETGEFFQEQTEESLIAAIKKFNYKKYDPDKIRHQAEKFSTERFKNDFKEEVDNIIQKSNIKNQN